MMMPSICIVGFNRVFRTRATLTIHQKQLNRDLTNAPLFVCPNCSDEFKEEGSMKNHYNKCGGERTLNGKKECKNCMKWIAKAIEIDYPVKLVIKNFLGFNLSTRKCRINRKKCSKREKMICHKYGKALTIKRLLFVVFWCDPS